MLRRLRAGLNRAESVDTAYIRDEPSKSLGGGRESDVSAAPRTALRRPTSIATISLSSSEFLAMAHKQDARAQNGFGKSIQHDA